MIIKPEGIIFFNQILKVLKSQKCFSEFNLYWICSWDDICLNLYDYHFTHIKKKELMKAHVFAEKSMFGNKAICIIFENNYYQEQLKYITKIKNSIRTLIKNYQKNSLYHILDLNKSGHINKAEETLAIQYDYPKPNKLISDTGFFYLQVFSYVHAPDPNEDRLRIEYDIVRKYINPKFKVNNSEYVTLLKISD